MMIHPCGHYIIRPPLQHRLSLSLKTKPQKPIHTNSTISTREQCSMAHKTEENDTDFNIVAETPTATDVLCEKCSAAAPPSSSKAANEDDTLRSTSTTKRRTFRRLTAVDPGRKAAEPVKRAVNRCLTCQRKVGLTGFRCRCGELFCADHRYSDRHDCGYDYKSAAREAIARENPVVKAPKVIKI